MIYFNGDGYGNGAVDDGIDFILVNPKPTAPPTPKPTPSCEPKPTRGPNVLKEIPVLDKDGKQIVGASGNVLVRPDDGQNFQFYVSSALEDTSKPGSFGLDSASNQLWNFKQNGSWDEQRIGSTNGQITNDDFVDISTVNIGLYGAILGILESVMLAAEAIYSKIHGSLVSGEDPAPAPYGWLGWRNYENTLTGYDLVNQGKIKYEDWLFCFVGPIIVLFLKKVNGMKKYRLPFLILAIIAFVFVRIHAVSAAQSVISKVIFPQPSGTTPPMVFKTLSQSVSPDKTWNAKLYLAEYQGDYAFQKAFIAHLQLTLVSSLSVVRDVVTYDTGGNADNNPSFTWVSPHTLVVTTKNDHFLTLHESSYSNVSIQYKYR